MKGMSENNIDSIKAQILAALQHPEAEEGLYFRNFAHLHEVDERPPVKARDEDIFEALKDLIGEGKVLLQENGSEATFHLAGNEK